MEKRCTSCGNVEPDSNAQWCSSCGARLPAASEMGSADAPIICPACGVENAPDARFCEAAGSRSRRSERSAAGHFRWAGPPPEAPPRQGSRLLSSAAEEPPGESPAQVLPVVRSEERAPCPELPPGGWHSCRGRCRRCRRRRRRRNGSRCWRRSRSGGWSGRWPGGIGSRCHARRRWSRRGHIRGGSDAGRWCCRPGCARCWCCRPGHSRCGRDARCCRPGRSRRGCHARCRSGHPRRGCGPTGRRHTASRRHATAGGSPGDPSRDAACAATRWDPHAARR